MILGKEEKSFRCVLVILVRILRSEIKFAEKEGERTTKL